MGRTWFTEDQYQHISSEFQNLTVHDSIEAAITIKPNLDEYKKADKSYGIDWCEMNEDLTEIVNFQETRASSISHIFDESIGKFKKNIINKDRQETLFKLYETKKYIEKEIPTTWINLAEGETAIVDLSVYIKKYHDDDKSTEDVDESKIELNLDRDDYIKFVFDDKKMFKIEYDGQENDNIKLDRLHNKKIKVYKKIKITALKTFDTPQYIILKTNDELKVGRIEMAANNTVNLGFKIIPVVLKSTDAEELQNAQKLYDDSLNSGELLKTLNTKSLNQAGILCSEESIRPSREINTTSKLDETEYLVVDVTKDNWKYFYKDNKIQDWKYTNDVDKPLPTRDEDGRMDYKSRDPDDQIKYVLDKFNEIYDREYPCDFKGVLIFITDKDYLGDPPPKPTVPPYQPDIAYSFNVPLRNRGVVVFKQGIKDSSVYPHEIGHLLGLEHNFFKDDNDFNNTNSRLSTLTGGNGNSISTGKQRIEDNIEYTELYIKDLKKELKDIKAKENPSEDDKKREIEISNEDLPSTEKTIQNNKDKLSRIDIYSTLGNFKVNQGKTKNYMDYIPGPDRTYFLKYQAEVLKKEVNDYYK